MKALTNTTFIGRVVHTSFISTLISPWELIIKLNYFYKLELVIGLEGKNALHYFITHSFVGQPLFYQIIMHPRLKRIHLNKFNKFSIFKYI